MQPDFEGTPLGWGASAGVHESQSRLWENIVGRAAASGNTSIRRCGRFPEQFGEVPLETFYRAINKVNDR